MQALFDVIAHCHYEGLRIADNSEVMSYDGTRSPESDIGV